MDYQDDSDAAMMAIMGLSGFGSTKVICSLLFSFLLVVWMRYLGKASRRESRRRSEYQEASYLAAIYEPVCSLSLKAT